MSVRMRFRTDHAMIAEFKAAGRAFNERYSWTREEWDAVPDAQPGDTWRIRWYGLKGEPGSVAGYAICCPTCRKVHNWTTASNCARTVPVAGGGVTCPHNGTGSCWTWTGSSEDGTLSASPSLYAINACGFHGFLTNGVLS